ncbi:MAG: efflux RND transporter periplasmic adaptor subunit [Nibricoccus sp.]
MKTRIVLIVLVALAILGGIFGYKFHKLGQLKAAMAARPAPVVTVTAIEAKPETWRSSLTAVGSLESYQGIVVKAEIEGRVQRVAFESGAVVKAGDALVQLDAASEEAQLKSLEARGKLAELTLARAKDLRANGTNAQADLDSAEANSLEAVAAIEELKATLAKKRIVAPFAGRLGIRQVNPGQFLNKGDALVVLEAVNPIYADFGLPQQDIANIQPGLDVRVTIDAFPARDFKGKIEAINPRISGDTRNVRVRAVLANPDELLRPGMFGRVEILLPQEQEVLVLPATAVVYSPYGDSVYVIKDEKAADGSMKRTVDQQFVQVGPRRGDQVSILKGLNAGAQVVSTGQNKLRKGAAVKVDNTIIPSNSPAPKPAES